MKSILVLFFILIPPALRAQQPGRESILLRLPYVSEAQTEAAEAQRKGEGERQGLEPLPDFGIPRQLPNEFLLTSVGWEILERSREANRFLVNGEPEKSVAIFREAMRQWPEELGLRVALADSLYALGDHREAVEHYEYVLKRVPLHFQCLNNLAWLHATTKVPELKNLDKAAQLAENAKIVQPRSHHIWSTLSQIYYERGEYAKAERAITNALQLLQQMQVQPEVSVGYLVQRDRCLLALQATSLLE